MSSIDRNLNLQEKDVHDFAYDIAQEFDKITSLLDIDLLIPLINKVINVLELLEQSVKKIEQLEKENSDSNTKYLQLNNERRISEDEIFNLKLTIEELEGSYSEEISVLKSFIDKLKAENKLLQDLLVEKNDVSVEIGDSYKVVIEDQEKIISKLKSNLKHRDNQLEKNYASIEALNTKVEDLSKLNQTLHNQYQHAKDLAIASTFEKREYEAKLYQQKQEFHSLENKFHMLKKSLLEKSEDSAKNEYKPPEEKYYLSEESLNFLLQEQHNLKQKVSKLQVELSSIKKQNDEYKKKFSTVTEIESSKYKSDAGRIQQIFHLFLGIINIGPELCWFRGI
ncbi:RH1 domain-containing protein [Trichonephila clavata]|uniref:RH1 domain-containing protein n=1 Tax=Trichonephila clavata TaxID=2740835 RepID=A0A8X6FCR7_TRICU|nr:RH1 domain-containing protein [Trichonephila clavata]